MPSQYVLGLDLDGVVADYYGYVRRLAAEWRGVPVDSLSEQVSYGLGEWGFTAEEYRKFHRFAVLERDLFLELSPVPGAPQAVRRLEDAGIRVRLVTHRLYLDHLHRIATEQTVRWLDRHAVPYSDLCLVRDKEVVEADLYVDDSPDCIRGLQARGRRVIAFTNSTNAWMTDVLHADGWGAVERIVAADHRAWLEAGGGAATGDAATGDAATGDAAAGAA